MNRRETVFKTMNYLRRYVCRQPYECRTRFRLQRFSKPQVWDVWRKKDRRCELQLFITLQTKFIKKRLKASALVSQSVAILVSKPLPTNCIVEIGCFNQLFVNIYSRVAILSRRRIVENILPVLRSEWNSAWIALGESDFLYLWDLIWWMSRLVNNMLSNFHQ